VRSENEMRKYRYAFRIFRLNPDASVGVHDYSDKFGFSICTAIPPLAGK
jgi:hypothetical protein